MRCRPVAGGNGPGHGADPGTLMLVVSANWSIGDGTLVGGGRARIRDWLVAVHRAAVRSGWRGDGGYAPLDALDVVLAGDTLDLLSSAAWLGVARPWDRGGRADAVRERVMLAATKRAMPLLAGLARWARDGVALPRAGRHHRPLPQELVRVPVRVTLLAGDRDRWLPLAVRRAARAGLRLGEAWSNDAVVVAHGAGCDPACFEEPHERVGRLPGGRPTLAESVAVDFVARFVRELPQEDGPAPATRGLRERLAAATVGEVAGIFSAWLRSEPGGAAALGTRRAVVAAWQRAAEAWGRAARRTGVDTGCEFDGIDAVATTLAAAVRDEHRGDTGWLRCEPRPAPLPAPLAAAAAELVVLGHPPAGPAGAPAPVGIVPLPGRRPLIVCLGGRSAVEPPRPGHGFRSAWPAPTGLACRRRRGTLVVEPVQPGENADPAAGVAVAGEAA